MMCAIYVRIYQFHFRSFSNASSCDGVDGVDGRSSCSVANEFCAIDAIPTWMLDAVNY